MKRSTQDIIQSFFKNLSEKNLNELINLFSEKVDWYIPGDDSKAPWLGRRTTKQEISEFYQLLWQYTEPVLVKLDHVFIDNNKAVISGEFSTKMLQTNKVVDSLFFIQIEIENELIVKYRLLEDTMVVANALTL